MPDNTEKMPPEVMLSYDKGDLVIKEGDYGISIYKILRGSVSITKKSDGAEIVLATLGPGDIFGEMVLWQLGKVSRTASVIAETKVKVGLLDNELLIKEYDSISPRLKSLFESLIHRLSVTTQRAVKLATE